MIQANKLEAKLAIGIKIRFGKKYAKFSGEIEGDIIELIEGTFEYDNGLYDEIQHSPSVWNEHDKEFDSIYHLFGNNFENWMDCEIITTLMESKLKTAESMLMQSMQDEHLKTEKMDRIIMFRGISISGGNWIYGQLILDEREEDFPCAISINGNVNRSYPVHKYTVGQFTGLKDKNGHEIYEGDILQFTEHAGYILRSRKIEVIYNDEFACFGYTIPSFIPEATIFHAFFEHDELQEDVLNYCEVIGNSHDNNLGGRNETPNLRYPM